MAISRRQFIHSATAVAAAHLLPSEVHSLSSAGRTRKLVVVHLRGGCDGLNLVVPHFDPDYYALRPTINIPRDRVIDLDGRFGFHPELSPLKPLWDSKQLAVVHAVGSPNKISGHFAAQRFVEGCLPCSQVAGEVEDVELEGWDIHYSQGSSSGRFAEHAREFAETLVDLWKRAKQEQSDVIIVALSEFGRSVAENARGGTDHGHAGAMLVLGSHLQGGRVYGTWPGLRDQCLQVTTGLQTIFSEILQVS
jgi:uncharacterized protein (DUF1501 family)